jgi:hypothetical protein
MKIESGRKAGTASGARSGGQAPAASGFAVEAEEAPRTAPASSASMVTALDAIIALQSDEPPAQRRARQAKRGVAVLDVLEKLERGLVFGHAPGSLREDMERLRQGGEPSGDPGLDAVLSEIDIRLAVELAKLDRMLAVA